jgi:hypothetical protein
MIVITNNKLSVTTSSSASKVMPNCQPMTANITPPMNSTAGMRAGIRTTHTRHLPRYTK